MHRKYIAQVKNRDRLEHLAIEIKKIPSGVAFKMDFENLIRKFREMKTNLLYMALILGLVSTM